MAEIVNLRIARKRKSRAAKADDADANRLAHGRSRAATDAGRSKAALDARRLDAHRRDRGDDPAIDDAP